MPVIQLNACPRCRGSIDATDPEGCSRGRRHSQHRHNEGRPIGDDAAAKARVAVQAIAARPLNKHGTNQPTTFLKAEG